MKTAPELTGLSAAEVREQFSLGLSNSQKLDTSRSVLSILRANFLTLFNAVVGGAFLVLLVLGQWQDALFGIAVIANVVIGVVQEYRSKLILDRLAILSQTPVRVRRDGATLEVRIEEVVRDDLLELAAGDQLPADARVMHEQGLEVDESMLTGEAEPVAKSIGQELLAGSGVTGGRALAQVIRVGDATYASKLVIEARKFSLVSSELRDSLNRLIKWISWALGPIMLIVIYGQLRATDNWLDAIVRSIASIISMVPQGLVLITSIAFAIAAAKLARQRVLLQELAAVEGLARVDVVCFDKTGTLTAGSIEFEAAIELPDASGTNWRDVVGEFAHQPDANATARALRPAFTASGLPITGITEFNSERKWGGLEVAGVQWRLGAPEMLTEDSAVLAQAAALAAEGRRTLLVVRETTPIALLTFREQVRPEATRTLEYFKSQGVSVRVISGDHPQTVAAVAKAAGLNAEGFDARNLPVDASALAAVMEQNQIFGRVTPEQKKAMVHALQQSGHVVAMIGDGVNDALALKHADLGIAMGSGAAATKAVANLVLLDNRFEALPNVVSEGRRVIANVERLSRLFLTKTAWAMTMAVVFGLMLWEFPFLPRQLSAVDGFAIGIPAFLLALLPNQQRYQPGFLRRALAFCIPAGLVTAGAVIALGGVIRSQAGWSMVDTQTATSMLLSVTGLWVLGSLARPWSALKLSILLVMVLTAIGMFLLPATTEFFGFSYLQLDQVLLTLTVGAVAAGLLELVNHLANRANSRRS